VITQGRVTALLGLGTGFNPEMSGLENIYLNGTIQGYSKEAMDAKLDDILSFADIGDFTYQPIKIYSSGMKARLAFALAINIDPEILIIDEVLAVGDELFRRKCYAKIERFLAEGKTILLVTHNVPTVNEICTRAIFLDRGELILEGSPRLVTTHYQKFLYARPGDKEQVRDEIILLNRDENKKNNTMCRLEEIKSTSGADQESCEEPGKDKKLLPRQKAIYLAEFQSKSKVLQKNAEIDVYDIFISEPGGEKVNSLVSNDEYYLHYKVRFNEDIDNFALSWAIKNEKGRVLSGVRYPGQKNTIESASKNEIYVLKWKFKCSLLTGIYYIDIGVPKIEEGERKVLVANYDALPFKVQKPEKDEKSEFNWAVFQMDQELSSLEVIS
jgi:lipopolysaccharide transport system ATP-binding protein